MRYVASVLRDVWKECNNRIIINAFRNACLSASNFIYIIQDISIWAGHTQSELIWNTPVGAGMLPKVDNVDLGASITVMWHSWIQARNSKTRFHFVLSISSGLVWETFYKCHALTCCIRTYAIGTLFDFFFSLLHLIHFLVFFCIFCIARLPLWSWCLFSFSLLYLMVG